MWSALRCVAPFAIAVVLAGCGDEPATTKTESGAAPPSTPGRWLPDGPKDAATVWAVGDGADGGTAGRAVGELIATRRVDRFLYLGDVYDEGSAEEYEEHYEPSWGKFADRTAPVAGNHEWDKRDEGYEPYWREKHGATPPHYYAFRAGGWELISLNSEIGGPEYGAQVDWLREQVKRRPGTCRLGFWHRPRYSASTRHGDEPDVDGLWTSLKGRIEHALFIMVGCTNGTYVYPARGLASVCADTTNAPASGQWLRLAMTPEEIDALPVAGWQKTIFRAFARYGGVVADTGGTEAFGFELESPETYRSFGVPDPWEAWAAEQALLPGSNVDTKLGADGVIRWDLEVGDGVDWLSALEVVEPCVIQRTC